MRWTLGVAVSLVSVGGPAFGCDGDDVTIVEDAGGVELVPDGSPARDAGPVANDARADAANLRCTGEGLCLTPLPIQTGSSAVVTSLWADSRHGAWLTLAGTDSKGESLAQVLEFDGDAWIVRHATLSFESASLGAITGDPATGRIVAFGTKLRAPDDPTLVAFAAFGYDGDAASFREVTLEGMPAFRKAWTSPSGTIWATSDDGTIADAPKEAALTFRLHELVAPGTLSEPMALWGTPEGDVFASGCRAFETRCFLAHSRSPLDGSAPSFTFSDIPGAYSLAAGWGFARNSHVYTVTQASEVSERIEFVRGIDLARVADGGPDAAAVDPVLGVAWIVDAFTPPSSAYGVWGRDENDIWIVGDAGRIYHFDGRTWSSLPNFMNGAPIDHPLTIVHGTSDGEVWIAGGGAVLHRRKP